MTYEEYMVEQAKIQALKELMAQLPEYSPEWRKADAAYTEIVLYIAERLLAN